MTDVPACVTAGVAFLWGGSHGTLTKQAVAGFGDISQGNRCVITMPWVAERPGTRVRGCSCGGGFLIREGT